MITIKSTNAALEMRYHKARKKAFASNLNRAFARVTCRFFATIAFSFNIRKATEVAAQFLQRSGGTINTMKLVKLIYLLDRLSLDRRGIPVVGGTTFRCATGRS